MADTEKTILGTKLAGSKGPDPVKEDKTEFHYTIHPKDRYPNDTIPAPRDKALHEAYTKGEPIRCKAKKAVMVEGKIVEKDSEVTLTCQQHRALGVHFETVLALLMLLALLLGFAPQGRAQQYQLSYANAWSSALYGVTNNGVNGGTNYLAANTTGYYYAGSTNTFTNTTVTATNINGQPYFTYITNITTNVFPAYFGATKYDMLAVGFGASAFGLNGTTMIPTNANVTAQFDWSADGTYWQSNAFGLTIAQTAAQGLVNSNGPGNIVFTNLWPLAVGYVRLDQIAFTNLTGYLTNITVEFAKKPIRTGP